MMSTLMVWDRKMDWTEGVYVWKKVETQYKVGTRQEQLFWRVIDSATSSKEFFYSPEDYQEYSGIPMSEYKEQADAWKLQYEAAEREFNAVTTSRNTTMIYNGQSYASFFPTSSEETAATIS